MIARLKTRHLFFSFCIASAAMGLGATEAPTACATQTANLLSANSATLAGVLNNMPEFCREISLLTAGEQKFNDKQYDQAQALFTQAQKLNPCAADTYLWLGGLYEWRGDNEIAACHYQKGRALARASAQAKEFEMAYIEAARKNGAVPARQLACSAALGQQIGAAHCGVPSTRGLDDVKTRDLVSEAESGFADLKVNFEYNSAALTAQGKEGIDQLITALKTLFQVRTRDLIDEDDDEPVPVAATQGRPMHPDATVAPRHTATFAATRPRIRAITLIGHTDERGAPAYNDNLSRRRAETVRDALAKAFPKVRYAVEGKGSKQPLIRNAASEDDHAQNRRVEIRMR